MKHLKTLSNAAIVMSLALVIGINSPVYAHDGADDQSHETTGSMSPDDRKTEQAAKQAENKAKREAEIEVHKAERNEKKDQLQEKRTAKKSEARLKSCESHKQGLTNKFSRIVANSQRVQSRIDGILDKAIAYQQNQNIAAVDFDNLVASAQTAKSTSSDSIAALQAITPTIDCNSETVAQDVKTFKTAAATTRDNLKAYRKAVKAVLKSLIEAKKSSDTEGSN